MAPVAPTDTIVQPRAVMVHNKNTMIAHRAVVGAWWSRTNTTLADRHHRVEFLRRLTGMCESGTEIVKHNVHEEPMPQYEVIESPPTRFKIFLREKTSVEADYHRSGQCDDKENQCWSDDMCELVHNADKWIENRLHEYSIVREFIITENAMIKPSFFTQIVSQWWSSEPMATSPSHDTLKKKDSRDILSCLQR